MSPLNYTVNENMFRVHSSSMAAEIREEMIGALGKQSIISSVTKAKSPTLFYGTLSENVSEREFGQACWKAYKEAMAAKTTSPSDTLPDCASVTYKIEKVGNYWIVNFHKEMEFNLTQDLHSYRMFETESSGKSTMKVRLLRTVEASDSDVRSIIDECCRNVMVFCGLKKKMPLNPEYQTHTMTYTDISKNPNLESNITRYTTWIAAYAAHLLPEITERLSKQNHSDIVGVDGCQFDHTRSKFSRLTMEEYMNGIERIAEDVYKQSRNIL